MEWETESEYNSDYFEIERSKDGIDWSRLFLIQATGEINSPTVYQETDFEPLEGISYYRLNQYDLDGAKTFLKSVSFNYEFEVGKNEIHVFPNPITDRVRVFGHQSELENLIIFNSIGQDISDNLTIINHNGYSEIYFRNQQEGLFILKSKTNSQILIKK